MHGSKSKSEALLLPELVAWHGGGGQNGEECGKGWGVMEGGGVASWANNLHYMVSPPGAANRPPLSAKELAQI